MEKEVLKNETTTEICTITHNEFKARLMIEATRALYSFQALSLYFSNCEFMTQEKTHEFNLMALKFILIGSTQ